MNRCGRAKAALPSVADLRTARNGIALQEATKHERSARTRPRADGARHKICSDDDDYVFNFGETKTRFFGKNDSAAL